MATAGERQRLLGRKALPLCIKPGRIEIILDSFEKTTMIDKVQTGKKPNSGNRSGRCRIAGSGDRAEIFAAYAAIVEKMKRKTNPKPGRKGTKKLCDNYGERLLRVRYRYDPVKMKRYKTVELIEEESEWEPPGKKRKTEPEIVGIHVGLEEANIQMQLRKPGAKWDRKRRLLVARKEVAFNMGLQDRIEVLDVDEE